MFEILAFRSAKNLFDRSLLSHRIAVKDSHGGLAPDTNPKIIAKD